MEKISITIFLLWAYTVVFAQNEYIKKHKYSWGVTDSTATFDFLQQDLQTNKVLMIGEYHGLIGNNNFEFALIKYVVENGYRVLLFEMPESLRPLLQDYVDAGKDEQLLKIIQSNYGIGKVHLFKNLYELNKELPAHKKLIIKTIGTDYSYSTGLFNLSLLLKRKAKSTLVINKLCDKIDLKIKLHIYGNKEKFLSAIEKKILFDTLFQKSLGNIKQPQLLTIIEGIKIGLVPYKHILDTCNHNKRERLLYKNAFQVIEEYKGEKFVGIFGGVHVSTVPTEKWIFKQKFTSFTAMLNTNNDSPVKGKIVSVLAEYSDFGWGYRYAEPEDLTKELLANAGPEFTLYKLNSIGTPWPEVAKIVQYVLINNIQQYKYWSIVPSDPKREKNKAKVAEDKKK